jgi:hypothetical protein
VSVIKEVDIQKFSTICILSGEFALSDPVLRMQAILNGKTAHCIITNVIRYQYSVLNIYFPPFLRYFFPDSQ